MRMNPPQRLTNNEANEWGPAWTADSQAVLIASNRNGTYAIYKQGASQEASEPVITGLQYIPFARLSSDGGWILFVETNPVPPQRLMRIPVSGGVPQLVLETTDWADFRCAPAPASTCVIFEWMSHDQKELKITAFDPVKGRGRVLRTLKNDPPHPYVTALSPDGSTAAISHVEEPRIQILLLSLSDGSDREITVKGWPFISTLEFSPDGQGFYCASYSPRGSTFLYLDLQGNVRALWQYKGGGHVWSLPSPDGRYLAIMAPVINANAWMLEGF
jgi:Tol biopolymer transport system component